jgi:glycosyltransferase involved in cell wall biosynthesis
VKFDPANAGDLRPATPDRAKAALRVLLVAENISVRLSGETLVPYYYLHGFLDGGLDVWAICHERVRESLRADLDPALFARITFVEDRALQRRLFALGALFPPRIADLIFNQLIHIVTQWTMRDAVRALIARHAIQVVFQPAPIAPKAPNFLFGLGVPVVIGPMSGAMDLPPAFRDMEGKAVRIGIALSRWLAAGLHRLIPGKRRAATLIVANAQTRAALPRPVEGRIVELTESGVDLARWAPRTYMPAPPPRPVRFIFCSRFVDWKGIRYLVEAFAPLARAGGSELDLVGDGELFDTIRRQVADAGIANSVILHGRVPLDGYAELLRQSDVYVTPSLRECGGMAMLEAMAVGLPIIGVDWGGAAQYTTPACAVLVKPSSKRALVDGLTDAMRDLAHSYPRRRAMGEAARRHLIDANMTWRAKAEAVTTILRDVTATTADPPATGRRSRRLPRVGPMPLATPMVAQ